MVKNLLTLLGLSLERGENYKENILLGAVRHFRTKTFTVCLPINIFPGLDRPSFSTDLAKVIEICYRIWPSGMSSFLLCCSRELL